MTASLPPGWASATADALTLPTGHSLTIGPFGSDLKVSDYRENGVPLVFVRNIRAEDFALGRRFISREKAQQLSRHVVRSGDLLITKMGDPPGDACIYPVGLPPAVITADCIKWTVNPAAAVPRFIVHALRSPVVRERILEMTRGVAQQKISLERFKNITLPLPPLPEQHRIVAALDTQLSRLDAAVAALKRAQENLRRYRASVVRRAVTGQLVASEAGVANRGTAGFPGADQLLARMHGTVGNPKDLAVATELPFQLPDRWTVARLATLGQLKGGITKGQRRKDAESLRSVPYLRVANVQRGYLDLREVKTIEATDQEIEELRLRPGDVLFNEGGDRDKLGRGWVWNDELETCIHQNHVFRARLVAGMNPTFVSLYANSLGQDYFLREGRQTTNLASINLTKLGNLPVPVPPTAEQDKIVAAVEELLAASGQSDAELDRAVARAVRLREALLVAAFSGRLVPQDPHDEPASSLLERIRAQRQEESPHDRRKGRSQPGRTKGAARAAETVG